MPEIQIRPAIAADIPILAAIDHNYSSEFVWQMELKAEEGQVGVNFREMRLPRSVRVEYPRGAERLNEDWEQRAGVLVALLEDNPIGYISLTLDMAPVTAWATDLAILRRLRRQGIGSALILAAQEWGEAHDCRRVVLEMQPKNHPAIKMAFKLGFDFCGYNDRFYANHDIALFFARAIR